MTIKSKFNANDRKRYCRECKAKVVNGELIIITCPRHVWGSLYEELEK